MIGNNSRGKDCQGFTRDPVLVVLVPRYFLPRNCHHNVDNFGTQTLAFYCTPPRVRLTKLRFDIDQNSVTVWIPRTKEARQSWQKSQPNEAMKKALLPLLSLCLGVISTRADLIWYEGFNYADGPINITGTNIDGSPNWFKHSGNDDAFVSNHKLENAASGSSTTFNRSGDNNRPLCTGSCTYTSAPTVLYASFTVNCSSLPDADGGYFAHFSIGGASFQGKVWAQASAAGLPDTWQLGVSGASSTAAILSPKVRLA